MKGFLFFLLVIFLSGCAQTAYSPSYIISDVERDAYLLSEED